MLGDISGLDKIYIVCDHTDMRKSIDGLCAIVEDQLKMDLQCVLFLFCGRRRDRIIDQIFLPPIIALTVFEGKAVCSIFILLHLVNRRGRLVFGYKWKDRIFFYRCAGNIPIPELKSGCNAKIKAKMKAILRFSRFSM